MTRYELTTLVADEATPNPVVQLIEAQAGQIVHEEAVGKRRLAYPINGLTNAVYHRITFDGDPARIAPLTAALNRDSQIVRHLLVIQRAEPISAAPVVDDAAIEALGDVKEMVAAEEKALLRSKKATEGQAPSKTASIREPMSEEVSTEKVPEQPSETVATTEEVAAADESAAEAATRQTALDEKLKSILGK